jgi:hypothetical protein
MLRVTLLSPTWRLVTALLVATSLATLPTYAIAVFVLPPIPPVVMARSFALGTILPALVANVLVRVFAGTIDVVDDVLRLVRADLDIEVPPAAIQRVRPWWIPLPRPGVSLRLSSGRLPVAVALDDPTALLERLAGAGVAVDAMRRHPAVVYARTRRRWRVPATAAKFVGFGLLPTAVFFYTHQHIAYGGTFGQYYLEGLLPYLTTFIAYWTTVVVLLGSYASVWRALAEGAVGVAAFFGDRSAQATRRAAEIACALAYYAGVPIILALRYRG